MDSGASHPDIEVIVVNYNAGDALTDCVLSILRQNMPLRVTVFDNASSDSSIPRLRQAIEENKNVRIISGDENPGFASAVNLAARELAAESQYLLIVNPDAKLLPGALKALRSALEQDPHAALAGPLVVDRQGIPMRGTVRRFPAPGSALWTFTGIWRLGRWLPALRGVEQTGSLPSGTVEAEAVSGACMMLKKAEFFAAGCMDGAYGLHCEDLDLMFRLHQRGFHCLYVPSARVIHDQGISSASRPVWVHWQKHRGMQRFFQKFQAKQASFPFRWLVIAGIWLRFAVTLPAAWLRS